MKKEENNSVPYSVLNQEERKVETVTEKPKKANRRGIAWFLGLVSLLGIGIGAKKIYDGSDLKYNNEIKSAYVKTIDKLQTLLPYPVTTIDGIRFYEPVAIESPAKIEVFATKDEHGDGSRMCHYDFFYELAYDYYQALKTAEESGDFQNYVAVLNKCFERMDFISRDYSYETTSFGFNEQQAKQFNEFFNLKDYNLNQVGFLPQYVDRAGEIVDDTRYVTYTIKGLSFVEVEKGEGDCVLPENLTNAVLNEKLNKKNIKVYETDFKFTYELDKDLRFMQDDFLFTLREFFDNFEETQTHNLKATPTYVNEIDLASFKMQENNFDFEKNN